MRLVFFGTSDFSVPSLRACAEHHDVAAVVTQPDRAGSRGKPAARPVVEVARAIGLVVQQPERIREPAAIDAVRSLDPLCIVVAAYGQILPVALLETPPLGAVNVHASLLPRWRGASPVAYAILAGDAQTGVSIMRMDAGLDTGPVYATRAVAISPGATTPALTADLAQLGAASLIEVLGTLESARAVAVPQPAAGVTVAPRLRREDGRVDWTQHSAVDIDRRVRALHPWPGVAVSVGGREVDLVAGGVVSGDGGAEPGAVLRGEGESLLVATLIDAYRIDRLRPRGGREMTPAAFMRGLR